MILNQAEIHQAGPRHVKNNLVFHKINKIVSGHFNTALITDKGELLIHGMNDHGQLALPAEISNHLSFFPEFMKIDFFSEYKVKDVALGSTVVHAIVEHKVTGQIKLFGWGNNLHGQLGLSDTNIIKREPYDMTSLLIEQKGLELTEDVLFDEDEITQVVSGGYHTLILIKKAEGPQQLLGLGKVTKGQLIYRRPTKTDPAFVWQPYELNLNLKEDEEIKMIDAGGLHSVALVGQKV